MLTISPQVGEWRGHQDVAAALRAGMNSLRPHCPDWFLVAVVGSVREPDRVDVVISW
jgi:hypothetical protein